MKKTILWSLVVFVFAFALRVYWIGQKQGINIDEAATHILSTYTRYADSKSYPKMVELSGEHVKKLTFRNVTSHRENLKLLAALRKDNNNEPTHTSLYFSVYRLWSVFGSDYFDLKKLVRRGCALNLVFFCFSFFFMYKLLLRLFVKGLGIRGEELAETPGSYSLVPLGLAAAYLNTGSISNTLYIREYQLQEMMFVLLAWVFVVFYQKIKAQIPDSAVCNSAKALTNSHFRDDVGIISFKNFFVLSVVLCFTMLSGYFSLLYIGLLGVVLLVSLSAAGFRWRVLAKHTAFLFAAFLSALALVLALYQGYFKGFQTGRFNEVSGNAAALSLEIVRSNLLSFVNQNINFVFYIPLIIILAAAFFMRKSSGRNSRLPLVLSAVGFLWTLAIIFIAPYKILRYTMPAIPLTAIIVPYVMCGLKNKTYKILASLYMLVLLGYSVLANPIEAVDAYNLTKKPDINFRPQIQNVQKEIGKTCRFNQKPELPVVIRNKVLYRFSNMVVFFNDDQKYVFLPSTDPELYRQYKHFFWLKGTPVTSPLIPPPDGYTVLDTFRCGYFTGYELEADKLGR